MVVGGRTSNFAAVSEVVGAIDPAVVGQLLVGLLAAISGAAHPGCAEVVNLEGQGGMRGPDQFVGLDRSDMLDLYHRVHRPLPIFTVPNPLWRPAPPWDREAIAVYRRGVARDLAWLADEHGDVRIISIDASHILIAERPRAVADAFIDFLAAPTN